jgi:hypothetical protein
MGAGRFGQWFSEMIKEKKQMKQFENYSRVLPWFMTFILQPDRRVEVQVSATR